MKSFSRFWLLFLLALLIALFNVFIARSVGFSPNVYPELLKMDQLELALRPFSQSISPDRGFLAGLSKEEFGQWVWAAFNLIIIPFSFGCVSIWAMFQFRKVIFVALGVGVTFVFVLYQMDLIVPAFGWKKIVAIFTFIWNLIVQSGVSASSAFFLGGWAGGYRQAITNQRSDKDKDT